MNDQPHTPRTTTVRGRVEWGDTDASGHQHYSFLLRMVDLAERQLMTDAGVVDEYYRAAPRVRHEIDYSARLYFGQEVTATITVERLGTSSMTLSFEVWGEEYRSTPRTLAATGQLVVAHVPQGSDRATPWPEIIRASLSPQS